MSRTNAAKVADEATRPSDPQQLGLRFFAIIEGYRRTPPDRALWRVLLDVALQGRKRIEVGGHAVSAADVHHVAWAIYGRSNEAGIVTDFALPTLAADVRRSVRTVRAAVRALNLLHVFRSRRPSRRRPAEHRLNLGGLDWPAVRARAGIPSAAQPAAPRGVSAAHPAPLSAAQPAAPKGYDAGRSSQRSTAAAAATSPDPAAAVDTSVRHRCACGHSWPVAYGDCCTNCRAVQRAPKAPRAWDERVVCSQCRASVAPGDQWFGGCVNCDAAGVEQRAQWKREQARRNAEAIGADPDTGRWRDGQ